MHYSNITTPLRVSMIFALYSLLSLFTSYAQTDTNLVSHTVGNKYYWYIGRYNYRENNEGIDPRENVYFTEEIRNDTLIQGKRYAAIYNSYLRSFRFERSDRRNLYEWLNGTEIKKLSLDAKPNDSVYRLLSYYGRVADLLFFDNFVFRFAAVRTERGPSYSFAGMDTSYVYRSVTNNTFFAVFAPKFGLRESSVAEPRGNNFKDGIFLHAARIDGRLYGDTLFGQPKTSVASAGNNTSAFAAPNPFSEQMQYGFQLYAPASVSVAVVNTASGQIVRSLPAQTLASGKHTYTWDGKDNDGKAAPAGAYIVQVYANDKPLATAKVVKQ